MPQKKRMRQIERQQRGKQRDKKGEKGRIEKTIGSIDIPDLSGDELRDQLKRMKAITPTGVAIQFNLKVSLAKRLLEELRRNGVVSLVSRSHNLKVYQLRTVSN